MSDLGYSPGLEGVVAGASEISRIDLDRNRLIIRGYDLVDLTTCTFEEVAHLLLCGALPDSIQLDAFISQLRADRSLPGGVIELMRRAPGDAHPMALLRTAVSALGLHDPEAGDNTQEANLRKSIRLLAKIPLAVAYGHHLAAGQNPGEARAELDHAANLLYMISGTEPAPEEAEAMKISQILYAEHGYNASAFAARVTASTLSDLHAAVTTAIGTLAGPLHGGANEQAMAMLLEIGGPEGAECWVLEALAAKKKIMGFGHREYKDGDSRVPSMAAVADRLASRTGEATWVETAGVVAAVMLREKGIFPNVDFPSAYAYYMMGIPIPLYTPIFVASRVAGWAAHVMEQGEGNRLIRPEHLYTGPEGRKVVPLSER